MSIFSHRSTAIEIMDDLQYEGEVIDQTLRELEIINRLLGGNALTIHGVAKLLKGRNKKEKHTITDLGCGGGDILKLVADWGRKNKMTLQLTGVDANPNIIVYAEKNSKDYAEIEYKAINIFSEAFRGLKTDIILATLFTHHFTNDELVHLLRSLAEQARLGIVINDLHRHPLAYHSIRILTRFFSNSDMVKSDAPLSVLRAFHKEELKLILERAGITRYTLRWRWAFRWELIIYTAWTN